MGLSGMVESRSVLDASAHGETHLLDQGLCPCPGCTYRRMVDSDPHRDPSAWDANARQHEEDHRLRPIDPVFNGNGTDFDLIDKTASKAVNGVLSGYKWAGRSISYSNPDKPSDYPAYYDNDGDGDGKSVQNDGFSKLDPRQKIAMHFALDAQDFGQGRAAAGFSVEGMTNLGITYAGDGKGNGTIRLANMNDYDGAYAFYPDWSVYGGDAWFGPKASGSTPGGWNWYVFLHELGHSLGLKHGHEAGDFGKLPANLDSAEFSVMTYRSYIGDKPGSADFEKWGAPQTYMQLDIAGLQHMYGADFSTNSGDSVYSWNPLDGKTLVNGETAISPGANRIFLTIWDGGGKDEYDLSAYATDLEIDLAPGAHSVFSSGQLAGLGGGPYDGKARGNVFNALQYKGDARSLIEDATGGAGNDRIAGNAAPNCLAGNGGRDTLLGLEGDDRLEGGVARDLLYGGSGDDLLFGGAHSDLLVGGEGRDTFHFTSARESRPGKTRHDKIKAGDGAVAFEAPGAGKGDLIDVSGIDVNPLKIGDQGFTWGGTTKTWWGCLYAKDIGSATFIFGNIDRDPVPEFELAIADNGVGAADYSAADFVL
ncbi:MAG TPA: M10 family metallopeptidase [Amaricoccus sp.]|nr:M10 family metallopeptidase [Amaricoccus sp.]HMR54143.1 M10 family metallopeptidase [Amaricoccus sp.]HMR60836.1 M10 family metallopeptidase [Amaricoccus sp.]